MGINGLLPVLKSITRRVHVSEYRGKRVAIDAYSWLHKGAFGCAFELGQNIPTDKFVKYTLTRVQLLKSVGVVPVLVFDGARLPLKECEENTRHRSRSENRAKAEEHMKKGNKAAATECYQRSIDVTPEMAKQLIDALKSEGVEFLVAPYEADAQMAYLAHQHDVHAIITEDSDLLAYACPRVLFKFDKSGEGQEIRLADLPQNKAINLVGFSHAMFLEMCIMAGCDFLKTLQGVGIKKAHKQMRISKNFVRACKALRLSGQSVPQGFESEFQKVIWLFRHQRVYCPKRKELVHLTPLPEGGIGSADVDVAAAIPEGHESIALTFLGPDIPKADAQQIATGNMHPMTRELFCQRDSQELCTQSSQSGRYSWKARNRNPTRISGQRRRPLPVQSVGLLNYFPSRTQGASQTASRQFVPPRSSGAAKASRISVASLDQESSLTHGIPSQVSESISSAGVAKKPRLSPQLKYDLSVFKCGKLQPTHSRGEVDVSHSDSVFQKRTLVDSQESSFACGLEHDAFSQDDELGARQTGSAGGLGSALFEKNLGGDPSSAAASDLLYPGTPMKRKLGRQDPPLNSTFSNIEIRGLDGEVNNFLGWTSPATPRSTPFFGKGDVSPDLLEDDLGLENEFNESFEGCSRDALGNLRSEDSSFGGALLGDDETWSMGMSAHWSRQLDLRRPDDEQGEENINIANAPRPAESGLGSKNKDVHNSEGQPQGGDVTVSGSGKGSQWDMKGFKLDQFGGRLDAPGTTNKFHSIRHVERFAAVARQTLDRLEKGRNSRAPAGKCKGTFGGDQGGQGHGKNTRKNPGQKIANQLDKSGLFSKFACLPRKKS